MIKRLRFLLVLLLVIPFMAYSVTLRLLPTDSLLLILDGGGVVFTDTLELPNNEYSAGYLVVYTDSINVASSAFICVKMVPYFTSVTDPISGVAADSCVHDIDLDRKMYVDTLNQVIGAQVFIVTIKDDETFGANDSVYVDPYFTKIPR